MQFLDVNTSLALQDRNLTTGLATLCLGGGDAVALSVTRGK